jgi:hypothetical protein
MKTVYEPARAREYVSHTTCDVCNEPIDSKCYEVDEVTIKYKTGESYPEGGSGEEFTLDCCGKCFKAAMMPFFKSINAEGTTEEWDW